MRDKRFSWSYTGVRETLLGRLAESAPSRIQLLTGPRQVGKTHLLLELREALGERVHYAAVDSPAAALPGWWETQWRTAEALASMNEPAVLLLDEVPYLEAWSSWLKAAWDRVVRENIPLHVVATGSSSLRLLRASHETMAGRFERLHLTHWPPAELVTELGTCEDGAAELAVRFGTYPGAVPLLGDLGRWRAYVRDAIVEPAIGRDILATETIRKPGLLRQVFAVAVGHPAEIVSLQKIRGALADRGALETIAHYLEVLENVYLVAGLSKLSDVELRRRAAPPKLIVLNQAILATVLQGEPPTRTDQPPLWGRWVENACAALAWNAGQTVQYWRAEPHEVDFVTSGSWGSWAVEVKTGAYSSGDLSGLLECCRRFPRLRPLVLCDEGAEQVAREAGVAAVPWKRYLIEGPPRGGG